MTKTPKQELDGIIALFDRIYKRNPKVAYLQYAISLLKEYRDSLPK